MKQTRQSLRTGVMEVAEVPCPVVGRKQVLVHATRTLVSASVELKGCCSNSTTAAAAGPLRKAP